MNHATTGKLPEFWREKFSGEPIPAWLESFQADADDAVDGLLTGRLYLGHLNVAERDLLLADWVERLGDAETFRERLDGALVRWIERYWGKLDYLRPASLADTWQRAANAIAFAAPHLAGAAKELRRHFGDRQSFLGVLSVAPSRDPLGCYLAALAANQSDDALASFWDWMCDLPQGVPLYHARYALEGVAGLPTDAPERCSVIGGGLLRLGRALHRYVLADIIKASDAEQEWKTLAYWCVTAFPFQARWREFAAREANRLAEPLPEPLNQWLCEVFALSDEPSQAASQKTLSVQTGWIPIQQWVQRAKSIRKLFLSDYDGALTQAKQLIEEQRKQPDPYFVVRSLCNFAMRVVRRDPVQALAWAKEAHDLDPPNPFTWTTLAEVQLAARQTGVAEATARTAYERFPRDDVAQNTYAKVLRKAGKLEQAAAIYRATIQHFPDDVVSRAGLADMLKSLDRLDEAEAVYRETIDLFPHDAVARAGLADVLKNLGRLDEAEAAYREVLELFGSDRRVAVVAFGGQAGVLREMGRYDDALEQVDSALGLEPNNTFALAEHERILAAQSGKPVEQKSPFHRHVRPVSELVSGPLSTMKRRVLLNHIVSLRNWAKAVQELETDAGQAACLRRQAAELVEVILHQHPDDERALAQKSLLRLDVGELDAAQREVEQALRLRPNAQLLLTLQARVDRLRAQRDKERLLPDVEPPVLKAPHRLRHLRPELRPVVLLQQGLGYLALTDGELRKEKASEEFGKLHHWIQHRLDPDARNTDQKNDETEEGAEFCGRETGTDADFNQWWGEELRRNIFDPVLGSKPLTPANVPDLAAVFEERTSFVDKLEECFVGRLAARSEWDPTEPVAA